MEISVKKLSLNREEVLKKFPPNMIMAEIGVWKGEFSQHIKRLANPSKLYLIDCWEHIDSGTNYSTLDGCNTANKTQLKYYYNVLKMHENDPRVEVLKMYASEASQQFTDKYFDSVYIDADHTYYGCLSDLQFFSSKIKDTGFIWGHDYTHCYKWIEVQRALQDFIESNPQWKLKCITSESPDKSPSWFLTQDNSIINDILDKIPQKNTLVKYKKDYLEIDFKEKRETLKITKLF